MNDLALFSHGQYTNPTTGFLAGVAKFAEFGRQTEIETIADITYMVNEFWTAKQRQSHSIHELSYRACFKAQLPQFFIDRLTHIGDIVLDPFMGRGTTLVQSALTGRIPYGNDINPLSMLLTRPRLKRISLQQISEALKEVDWNKGEISREDLLAFYHPNTLKKLESLKLWLAKKAPLAYPDPDPVADWIRMVAINRLSGHSPGFFSVRSMPPNQAVSVKTQCKLNALHGNQPAEKNVAALIMKKSESLLKNGCVNTNMPFSLHTGLAWDIPIPDASVSLVVTSPPFLDTVDYASDNWLRCWFAGIDIKNVAIDMHQSERAWTNMVNRTLRELARVVRPGGYIAFEVGEVRGGKLLLEKLVWQAAEGLPFDRLGVMVNTQNFTKTANCWGVVNGIKGTNTNRIVILQRH